MRNTFLPCLLLAATLGRPLAADDRAPPPPEATAPAPPASPGARAEDIVAKMTAKYGKDAVCRVDERLHVVFVTDGDPRVVEEARRCAAELEGALSGALFTHGPRGYLAVVIPKAWRNGRVTGHFYPGMVDARTVGGALRHEFTHALHHDDQAGLGQTHPVWLVEGLAGLFERSHVVAGRAVPDIGFREVELQQEVAMGKWLPWERMLALEHKAFTSHHYAQARSMLLYLERSGDLKRFYDLYTAGFAHDATGATALEAVRGKPLGEIERDWKAWLLGLPAPFPPPGPQRATLAAALAQIPDGLRIESVGDGGPAAAAGLRAGDVITALDDEPICEADDLIACLLKRRPGELVRLGFRREGSDLAAPLELGGALAVPATGQR